MHKLALRERLTGGAPLFPLAVLFGLNISDELDALAFQTLTPEIRDAFGLSNSQIIAMGTILALAAMLGAVPAGVIGDRANRVRVVCCAALIWGLAGAFTGLASTFTIFVVLRVIAGLARVSNEPIHSSLLGDLYPPRNLPGVFFVHRLANPGAAAAGVLIGWLGSEYGWQTTFVLISLPTFVIALVGLRLKEPVRGGTMGETTRQPAVPFREACRQLFAVKTLRGLWAGALLLGVLIVPLRQLHSLFFEQRFGYGPVGRGTILALGGIGLIVGIVLGAIMAERAVSRGNVRGLGLVVGFTIAIVAGTQSAMVLMPWESTVLVVKFFNAVMIGAYQPAFYTLVTYVSPPRVRAQAYAWAYGLVGAGGVLSLAITTFTAPHGAATSLLALAWVAGLSGTLILLTTRYIDNDHVVPNLRQEEIPLR
ncbi:MFS transporter [Lentzea tibetensis]|uniref:MFS transporter n=1 Tax=Lentzea tibetensis TaxID=2591470 RepID=A0A563EJ53_9PSEU|nr:MFS transporter [Lentzea tibetensis]TWP46769.1 MFS transporter [Lentzea tibetensis]